MPASLAYEQAAPATESAHYAVSHIRRAKIGSGHNVLVYGATGAIGSAAVQLLKTLGATVTAVCAPPHLELVRKLGADKVIDYTAGDFTRGGPDYDVVFDAAGKNSFGRCQRLLKPGGIYMSTGPGPWYQNLILPLTTPLLGGKKVVFAYPSIDQATVRHFAQLMASGQFTPVIDRQYPPDQIVEAYRYVETGQKIGNVVIIVDQARKRPSPAPRPRAGPLPDRRATAPGSAALPGWRQEQTRGSPRGNRPMMESRGGLTPGALKCEQQTVTWLRIVIAAHHGYAREPPLGAVLGRLLLTVITAHVWTL